MPAIDLVEELRLRRWARENYVASGERDSSWNAVIHDEMSRRDEELALAATHRPSAIVPLAPAGMTGDRPHALRGPKLFSAIRTSTEMHYN